MLVIPAIDILNGQCVRLYKGSYEDVKVYHPDPVTQARELEQLGIKRLHLVDLNGAKEGTPVNRGIIEQICSRTALVLELGGGIRTLDTARLYLEAGVKKIILGSALVKTPDLALELMREFGNDVLVAGIDFKNDRVAISGWLETFDKNPLEFALELKSKGVAEFIFTDISKDGTLSGPNVGFYQKAVKALGSGVIASGGIGSDVHLGELKSIEGLFGVIVGKAFYENKVNLSLWV